jgi:hypothetical protein
VRQFQPIIDAPRHRLPLLDFTTQTGDALHLLLGKLRIIPEVRFAALLIEYRKLLLFIG